MQTIKVGAMDLTVETVEDEVVDFWAQLDHNGGRIVLNDAVIGDQKMVTLWHEIIHSLLAQGGYLDHNESHIETLGYGIVQVLKNNPDLRMNE